MIEVKRAFLGLSVGIGFGLLFSNCGGGSTPVAPGNTPTPTSAPTAQPTPTAWVCPMGAGVGAENASCKMTHKYDDELFAAVRDAVWASQAQHPEWFIFYKDGTVKVNDKDRKAMFDFVVDTLNSKGYCALNDAHGQEGDGLEVAVKRNNGFNEQYKFWVTKGWIRVDRNMHIATCEPSWF